MFVNNVDEAESGIFETVFRFQSSDLVELEVSSGRIEATHAPALARALRPAACRLRVLCLQRASLAGEALLCLGKWGSIN